MAFRRLKTDVGRGILLGGHGVGDDAEPGITSDHILELVAIDGHDVSKSYPHSRRTSATRSGLRWATTIEASL